MSWKPKGKPAGDVAAPSYSMAEFVAKWEGIERESAELIGPSLAELLALKELDEPGSIDELLELVGPRGWQQLAFDVEAFWLRPKQQAALAAADAEVVGLVGGRGMGKTQTGAGWCISRIERGSREMVLVGPSDDEVEQYMVGGHKRVVEGDLSGSGLLDRMPPWMEHRRDIKAGTIEVRYRGRTTMIYLHSAHNPEFRGPNPDSVWCDEPIKWRFPERLLTNLRLACRAKGRVEPQLLVTTSPKRRRWLRDLAMEPGVRIIHGTTHENRGNVTDRWIDRQAKRLAGTKQGAEEIEGRLLGDDGSGVFTIAAIDDARVDDAPRPLDLVVVSIDPSASEHVKADMTGIVVVGRKGTVDDGHAYVLEDATDRHSWDAWGTRAYVLAELYGATAFVCERNKYADAVAANLRTAGARRGYEPRPRPGFKHLFDMVHTKTGKRIQIVEVGALYSKADRAGPVSTLYEQRRVHHVGHLTRLETEMTEFEPSSGMSPNAMDALVHGITELFALDSAPKRDGREAFRGLSESLSGRPVAPAEQPAPGPAASGGSLASMLATLQRGHWGSRI